MEIASAAEVADAAAPMSDIVAEEDLKQRGE